MDRFAHDSSILNVRLKNILHVLRLQKIKMIPSLANIMVIPLSRSTHIREMGRDGTPGELVFYVSSFAVLRPLQGLLTLVL